MSIYFVLLDLRHIQERNKTRYLLLNSDSSFSLLSISSNTASVPNSLSFLAIHHRPGHGDFVTGFQCSLLEQEIFNLMHGNILTSGLGCGRYEY